MRSGLLGKKLGMTRVLGEDGAQYAVSVVQVEPHKVLSHKTVEKHGYDAAVIGTIEMDEKKAKNPMKGFFKAIGSVCFKKIKEFRGLASELPAVGENYGPEIFDSGVEVDVTGTSIGKGFAGPMKRHNFGGLRATHGVSLSHRSHGSTGNRTDPGKVFKGKKMAGQMGNAQVTMQNMKIHSVDGNLLLIRGGIPGPDGGYVLIRNAIKRMAQQ